MQSALLKDEFAGERIFPFAIGKVSKVYPQANMVDVSLFNGTLLQRVQILSLSCSSKTGKMELPIPEYEIPLMDQRTPHVNCKNPNESDVFAIVGFLDEDLKKPIVFGFLFPEENEILCDTTQPGNSNGSMFLWKHKSNVYTNISEGGDIEISHPSGVFIKIGNSIERTEIANYDRQIRPFIWKNPVTGELSDAPYIHIEHPSGNYYTIDPDGNVTEMIVGNVDRTIQGNLNETIQGNVVREIDGDVSETCKGDWERDVDGILTDKGSPIEHNE
jgi:hypothetical protein